VPRISDRYEIARIVGKLIAKMEGRTAILLGPGRWGSNNICLGVPVKYNEKDVLVSSGDKRRDSLPVSPVPIRDTL